MFAAGASPVDSDENNSNRCVVPPPLLSARLLPDTRFRTNLKVRGRAPHEQERGFPNSRNLHIVYSSRAFEASCVCAVPPCPGAADQENHEPPRICTLPIRYRILFARYRKGPLRVEFATALRAWLHNQVAHGGHSARALRWRLPLPYQGLSHGAD